MNEWLNERLTCSVGSRVWSGTGTSAAAGTQTRWSRGLRRRREQSGETSLPSRSSPPEGATSFVRLIKKKKRKSLTCSADGEDHLDRVEEEEHDQQGDRGSDGEEEGLRGVYSLNTCNATQHNTTTHMRRGAGGTNPRRTLDAASSSAPHSLLFVLPLLKAPGAVTLPSLSFSWFSQSMFSDLQQGGDGTQRQPAAAASSTTL